MPESAEGPVTVSVKATTLHFNSKHNLMLRYFADTIRCYRTLAYTSHTNRTIMPKCQCTKTGRQLTTGCVKSTRFNSFGKEFRYDGHEIENA